MIVTPQMLLNDKKQIIFQFENSEYEIKQAPCNGVSVAEIDATGEVLIGWFPGDFPFFEASSLNDFNIYDEKYLGFPLFRNINRNGMIA